MIKTAETYHVPVLLKESVDGLNIQPGGIYVDVTFGGGGHSREIISRLSEGAHLYSFDQDADAERNVVANPNFTFVCSNFRYLKNWMRYYGVEGLDGLLCLSTVVHLGKHLWEGTAHLIGIAIHIPYESLADTLKTISVHRKIHLGCIQLDGSIASLARTGAFPFYGTMLCHSVVVNAHTRIQSTSLILVDNEVRCLLDIGIHVLPLLADRTETRGLTFDALLVGRLHEKVQVDVGETIYYRMKEHSFPLLFKRDSRRCAKLLSALLSLRGLQFLITGEAYL